MSDLPLEIWYVVCQHYDRLELKTLRFVNRDLNRACIPKLFRTLHLRPTLTSLSHAISVAQKPDLAPCVRNLVLSEELVEITHSYHSFQNRVQAIWGPQASEDHIARKVVRDEQLYSEYVSTLDSERWDLANEGDALIELIPLLPNLRNLRRVGSEWTENLLEYREVERVFNEIYLPQWQRYRRAFSFAGITGPDVTRTIKTLDLNPVHVQELFEYAHAWADASLREISHCLHNLTELKLVLFSGNSDISLEIDNPFLQALGQFFSLAPNISALSIRLLQPLLRSRSDAVRTAISASVLQQHYLQLRRVEFDQFSCTEVDLLSFAINHTETLRSMTLHNIQLHDDLFSGRPASILRLCWNLRNWLTLDHFCVGGELRVASRERWNVATNRGRCIEVRPESITSSCILHQLCESVCGRAEFPFRTKTMIDSGMEPTDDDIEYVIELITGIATREEINEQFADDSWRWIGWPSLF